uniref:Uncharacterized protein n=1 Tax=Chromera velia CCMP2878 TaxID=1169474 RepID=A0A0G4GMX8_9ALVE|mmetsp:Transcript_54697/g.106992  ORF Transcript_54697/g.106992 Transcript_54697/m.106992 type:complete len:138 (-) Transcript_54697:63-476(-)|eukprot:Cvel_4935.t1-p1 / transcript=Cvel_4935.t1 / gene=Cvel_4935 / organism=Chromera_velia_CCMP2878 / gene_product=hypothetical protein / transcript_product=hypothetical protein / location=Cvel_scaffold223:29480-30833(+) / protein_length=137 / sequence_SO=supercontig / SO=protein_coding / is_pseudo=false
MTQEVTTTMYHGRTDFSPRSTLLTPTTGSGLKQRIRELEALIDNDLRNAQVELEALRKLRQFSPDNTKELIEKMKEEIIAHFEDSKSELKKFFIGQRQENLKLHEHIKTLRNENATLQQSILALQRRLQAIEEDIGQ